MTCAFRTAGSLACACVVVAAAAFASGCSSSSHEQALTDLTLAAEELADIVESADSPKKIKAKSKRMRELSKRIDELRKRARKLGKAHPQVVAKYEQRINRALTRIVDTIKTWNDEDRLEMLKTIELKR